ncbi:murein hydrolase activator EnvC [Psychromonas sp. MME1]|uniref:murein hydrolase activator EnvC family protein n=1 Tax=Psychromonas sp. MME1 TaxID=3231032 RepID=UPI0034E2D3E6
MKSMDVCKKIDIKTLIINIFLLLSLFTLPLQNSLAANDLSTLQKQIKKSKLSTAEQTKKRLELEELVAQSEQETAIATLQAEQTNEALLAEGKRLKELKVQTEQLQKDTIQQQKLLQQQLISAYMAGQNDLIKLLLNQDDLSKIIRAKSYYFYLSKARSDSLETLQTTLQQLDSNKTEQAASLAALEKMHAQQKATQEKLLSQRQQRETALQESNRISIIKKRFLRN